MRIKPFTAAPQGVAAYGAVEDESATRRFELTIIGMAKGMVLATIDGVTERDAAAALKGMRLYVPRAALPPPEPDEFYHADLIGLEARDTSGRMLGTVTSVVTVGETDTLEITPPGAATLLVPFTREIVPEIDLEAGHLVIDPPPGLFDAEGER